MFTSAKLKNHRGLLGMFATVLTLICTSMNANAVLLHAVEDGDELLTIDTNTLVPTSIGSIPNGPEIQLDPTGSIIYSGVRRNSPLAASNPSTSALISSVALSGWPNSSSGITDTLTAMEFVGSTLYGAATVSGPEDEDSRLVTVNTTSGVITDIGSSLTPHPLTGMAYDAANGIMYGITGTNNNNSQLVTINLLTGAASVVGQVTLGGVQQEAMTSLVFGSDGVLYTTKSRGDTNLYSIDKTTGALTNLGDTGLVLTALTAPPLLAPISLDQVTVPYVLPLAAFGFGLLILFGRHRRQRG